jgi:VanZ family protein
MTSRSPETAARARCPAQREGLTMVRSQSPKNEARLVQLSRAVGSACVVVIIVLSVLPANERPHTGFPGQMEHAAAYFGTAIFLAFGYPTARGRIATIALLVGLAAALEMIQLLIPGRNSQFIDWYASSFGAGFGVLAVILMERLLARTAGRR